MLEILKDPGHEEYEDYLDWIGGEFDPNYFDKDKVNKLLKRARVK
jgi:lysine/ornithine N-monooxygenase